MTSDGSLDRAQNSKTFDAIGMLRAHREHARWGPQSWLKTLFCEKVPVAAIHAPRC